MSVLKAIDAISEWSGRIFGYLIYVGCLVLVYEVAARYFFGAPTVWAHGVSQRVFAVYFIIGGAYALRHRAHIRMDLIYNRLSSRGKAVMDLVTYLFLFIVIFVLLYTGSIFAWTSLSHFEVCGTPLHAPIYVVKLFLPLAGFLLLLQGCAMVWRDLLTFVATSTDQRGSRNEH